MKPHRPIHPHFQHYLDFKEKKLIDLYCQLRQWIFEINPDFNELLYHTHALVSVYSLSDRLSEAYCMIPIYSKHLNLGFHHGAILEDRNNILQGTGKRIRHIPIQSIKDFRNQKVEILLNQAIHLQLDDMETARKKERLTISKIKM